MGTTEQNGTQPAANRSDKNATDENGTQPGANPNDGNATKVPRSAVEACKEKFELAKKKCVELSETDHFDGCMYDWCMASAEDDAAGADSMVTNAKKALEETQNVKSERAARQPKVSSETVGCDLSLTLMSFYVAASWKFYAIGL